jgi:hypothetical protein
VTPATLDGSVADRPSEVPDLPISDPLVTLADSGYVTVTSSSPIGRPWYALSVPPKQAHGSIDRLGYALGSGPSRGPCDGSWRAPW